MALDFETYKDVSRNYDKNGKFMVLDKGETLEDFDQRSMTLHKGEYTMIDKSAAGKALCLIKKFQSGLPKQRRSYSLLKNIKHPSIVSVESFYGQGEPRFVLSWVDGSISAWVKSTGAGKLIQSTMRGSYPTPTYRQIIIDLCSGLEHLLRQRIYPIKIGVEDICMHKVGKRYIPKLLILEAQKLGEFDGNNHEKNLWAEVRAAVRKIFDECPSKHTGIDPISLRFFNYIGKCSAKKLKQYPIAWNEKQKAEYLLWIMSLDKEETCRKVQDVGIGWPRNMPFLLSEMIRHDEARENPSDYDVTNPYDYLLICKNIIKHWLSLPESIKGECPDWERFVQRMDVWTPLVWCILYEIFG